MQFHFQVWFEDYPRRAVVLEVEAWMREQGLGRDEGLRRRSSIVVNTSSEPVEVDVTAYASGHVVWSVLCPRPTPQLKALCEQAMAHALRGPRYSEAILAWGTLDAHPLLAHEQWRVHDPVALSVLDERTLHTTILRPDDEGYWEHMGPRVHVLSFALVGAHSSPQELERILGTTLVRTQQGWGGDCGWSARWGAESLKAMGLVPVNPILH